jgi:hypothetical protein
MAIIRQRSEWVPHLENLLARPGGRLFLLRSISIPQGFNFAQLRTRTDDVFRLGVTSPGYPAKAVPRSWPMMLDDNAQAQPMPGLVVLSGYREIAPAITKEVRALFQP